MRSSLMRAVLGLILFSMSACSSANPEAPPPTEVHAERYLLAHAAEAGRSLNDCMACHQSDFQGTGNVTNCLDCHADGAPFARHPLPYTDPALHGPAALVSLKACLGCHGRKPNRFDGGILSDPDLFAAADADCTACHPTAGAHPTSWQGRMPLSNGVSTGSHRSVSYQSIASSCALCHQVTPDSPAPLAQAPSCFTAGYTNGDGVTSGCHAGGFGNAAHVLPFTAPNLHGAAAKSDLAACQSCHGTAGTIAFDGGSAATACSSAACHPAAGAHPTSWLAGNNAGADYVSSHSNAANQSSACIICHDVTQGRSAPNPAAPSCYSATFSNMNGITSGCHAGGPSAPHALPFTNPDKHGPEAKADLKACASCHAEPSDAGPGDNPRFNRTIGDLAQGCEDCHNPQTAHPTLDWFKTGDYGHDSAANLAVACALCHGADLSGPAGGGVGPACSDCHSAGSPVSNTGCTSCHGRPPAGNTAPDRAAAHGPHVNLSGLGDDCQACHDGAGSATAIHRIDSNQDVRMPALYTPKTGATPQYDRNSRTCSNVSCHGGLTTPDWFSGRIDIRSDCQACHRSGTAQYNSYYDEAHRVDDHNGLNCTDCHDPDKLAVTHFTNLATPGFDGDAADSIRTGGCAGCHG